MSRFWNKLVRLWKYGGLGSPRVYCVCKTPHRIVAMPYSWLKREPSRFPDNIQVSVRALCRSSWDAKRYYIKQYGRRRDWLSVW